MSLSAAFRGLAEGVGEHLTQQHEEELAQRRQQTQFMTTLVSNALASGNIENPDQAIAMLFGKGGKPGKVPPQIDNLVNRIKQHYQQPEFAGTPFDGNRPSPSTLLGQPYKTNQQIDSVAATAKTQQEVDRARALIPVQTEASRAQIPVRTELATAEADATSKARESVADRLKLTGTQRNEYIATGRWPNQYAPRSITTKLPAAALPDDAIDLQGKPIEKKPGVTYTVRDMGEKEDGSPDLRYIENAATAVDPFKGLTPTVREFGKVIKQEHPDWDDEKIVGEAVRKDIGQKVEDRAIRNRRAAQLFSATKQQMDKREIDIAYAEKNQPLLLEAKRLQIDLAQVRKAAAQQKISIADELAKRLGAHPQSSVKGQDLSTIAKSVVDQYPGASEVPTVETAAKTPVAKTGAGNPQKADLEKQATALLAKFTAEKDAAKKDALKQEMIALRAKLAAIK